MTNWCEKWGAEANLENKEDLNLLDLVSWCTMTTQAGAYVYKSQPILLLIKYLQNASHYTVSKIRNTCSLEVAKFLDQIPANLLSLLQNR